MVLLSARNVDVGKTAFTSPDRVREVLHNFKRRRLRLPRAPLQRWPPADVHPAQRRKAKKLALSRLADHELPFSTWSLSKLAEHLVAEGVVDDINHEGLRALLREEGVSFRR